MTDVLNSLGGTLKCNCISVLLNLNFFLLAPVVPKVDSPGGGGGEYWGRFLPGMLASQSPYSIIVYSLPN